MKIYIIVLHKLRLQSPNMCPSQKLHASAPAPPLSNKAVKNNLLWYPLMIHDVAEKMVRRDKGEQHAACSTLVPRCESAKNKA